MSTRTLTALYDSQEAAEQARDQLRAAGVGMVDIHNQDAADTLTDTARTAGEKTRGLLDKIAAVFGGHHEDAHGYAEGVRRGHYLLTAKVDDASADAASGVLDRSGAVDFDRAQASWRAEGWAPGQRAYDQGASTVTASDIARDAASASAFAPAGGRPPATSATGAAAATAEDFGEPASTGAQVAPELPAETTIGASGGLEASAPADRGDAVTATGLGGGAALERVTDGGDAPRAADREARREDARSTAYVRSYVSGEHPMVGYAAEGVTRGEAAGEGLLTQDSTVRDVFQPKADENYDLDQGLPPTDIRPGGSLNRPA